MPTTFTDGVLASAPTGNTGLAIGNVFLYRDAIDHLVYMGQGGAQDASQRDIQTAIQNAYRDVAYEHSWNYYKVLGRINLVASYSTGTITYTHSTLTVTFSTALSSTVQTWARFGRIKIGNVIYPVRAYTSTTTVLLDDQINPGADVAAGTSYTLFRDTYQLPANCVGIYKPEAESGGSCISLMSATEKIYAERRWGDSGQTNYWTLIPDPDRTGSFCIQVHPYPTSATTLDFLYLKTPRPIRLTGIETATTAGTIANSASATAITGTSTTFAAHMVGSYLRTSQSTTAAPTGLGGNNPFDDQRQIDSFTSTTVIGTTPAMSYAHSGTKYLISDPIEIAPHMMSAFLRACEFQLALARGKDSSRAEVAYERALLKAKETDSMLKVSRVAGGYEVGGDNYTVDFSDVP
jgi:hypothetical protein